MPVSEHDRERMVESVRTQLRSYGAMRVEEVTRPELGNDLNFEPVGPSVARIIEFCRDLAEAPLEGLSSALLQTTSSALGQLESRFREIKSFNVLEIAKQREDPVARRNSFINQFSDAETPFWNGIAAVAALAQVDRFRREPTLALTTVERTLAAASDAVAAVEKSRDELSAIVEASRQAAVDVGVTKHAVAFSKESEQFEASAQKWLWATTATVSITLLAVSANLWYSSTHPPLSGEPVNVQLILAKVLGFSLLISATVWCGKMFRAAKHNWVVNRHRQNALATFQAFVQGTADEPTKNAILLHAAQSIFQAQPSAYSSGDGESSSSPGQLIEVVRTMTPQSK